MRQIYNFEKERLDFRHCISLLLIKWTLIVRFESSDSAIWQKMQF